MPVYVDSDGRRYWFDAAPDPALTRADLVLAQPEFQDGPDAQEVGLAQVRTTIVPVIGFKAA